MLARKALQDVQKRRKRERLLVAGLLIVVSLFGSLEGWFFSFRSDLSFLTNVFLFGLINLNVLLLLLLAYLVLRNIVKLIFEYKKGILGTRLKTRLVIAFIGLTLIPTLPLFGLATQFISLSLEYWFSHQVEQSLEQSIALGRYCLSEEGKRLAEDSLVVAEKLIEYSQLLAPVLGNSVERGRAIATAQLRREQKAVKYLRQLLDKYHLRGIFWMDSHGRIIWQIWQGPWIPLSSSQLVDGVDSWGIRYKGVKVTSLAPGSQIIVALFQTPDRFRELLPSFYRLGVVRAIPPEVTQKLNVVTRGYENYLQLKLLQHPFKISYFVVFSIVTLLVIFAAIWFGFFLAKNITVPIQEMLDATEKMAKGDLDVQVNLEREDEIGRLITSFNKMVRDLRENRRQLATAYKALQANHTELEQRRRYMEIVLAHIGAGVISVDSSGTVVTMNKSAERILGLKSEEVIGRPYTAFLQPQYIDIAKSFFHMYQITRQSHLEQQLQIMVGNRLITLLVKVSVLRDENNEHLGAVVVFDDLTELEKAHRMAAWREVARRIAHEIKNPLTPIQLSAQRLRRRYSNLVQDESGIFDECTRLIIDQVARMKRLVNEFSNFARLPQANPVPCHLQDVVKKVVSLYRHSYPDVVFRIEQIGDEFPMLRLDCAQFEQVIMNLLDNAIHALDGSERRVEVRLSYDSILKIARIEVADTGKGLSAEDKLRIFEPYYSTKEKGRGLGLAIVARIVADHRGFIRVRDNTPRGTIIVIELPG